VQTRLRVGTEVAVVFARDDDRGDIEHADLVRHVLAAAVGEPRRPGGGRRAAQVVDRPRVALTGERQRRVVLDERACLVFAEPSGIRPREHVGALVLRHGLRRGRGRRDEHDAGEAEHGVVALQRAARRRSRPFRPCCARGAPSAPPIAMDLREDVVRHRRDAVSVLVARISETRQVDRDETDAGVEVLREGAERRTAPTEGVQRVHGERGRGVTMPPLTLSVSPDT
jgi:hypothetical protein